MKGLISLTLFCISFSCRISPGIDECQLQVVITYFLFSLFSIFSTNCVSDCVNVQYFFQLLPNVATFEEFKLNSALAFVLYSVFNSGLGCFFFLGTHRREPWQVARPACHPIGWWHLSDMKITLCASHWGSTIPVQLSSWTNCLCVFLVIKS